MGTRKQNDAYTLDELVAEVQANHARHDDNFRCVRCGSTRYAPLEVGGQGRSKLVCYECDAVTVHRKVES